jgi:hypothetical protein
MEAANLGTLSLSLSLFSSLCFFSLCLSLCLSLSLSFSIDRSIDFSLSLFHSISLCLVLAPLFFSLLTQFVLLYLGGYLFHRTDEEVEEALAIIGRDRYTLNARNCWLTLFLSFSLSLFLSFSLSLFLSFSPPPLCFSFFLSVFTHSLSLSLSDESGPNYITSTAMAVLNRFGFPTNQPSLGIPTVSLLSPLSSRISHLASLISPFSLFFFSLSCLLARLSFSLSYLISPSLAVLLRARANQQIRHISGEILLKCIEVIPSIFIQISLTPV